MTRFIHGVSGSPPIKSGDLFALGVTSVIVTPFNN